jgi:hypothetical protein
MFSVKHIYKKTTNKKWMLKKKILPSTSHVKRMELSHRCAWQQNHEHVGSGYPYRTMTVEWNAQTSCAECIPPIQPLRHMAIWNPSKPPYYSNLEALFLLHIFWISFAPRTKNHAIYMVQITYLLANEK